MKVIRELQNVSYSDRLFLEKALIRWMEKESVEDRLVNILAWLDDNDLLARKEVRKYVLIRKEGIGDVR